jgi:hypothetical protein
LILFALFFTGCADIQVRNNKNNPNQVSLFGNNEGLFSVSPSGSKTALWTGGAVRKILALPDDTWAMLTNEGIFVSPDLKNWEARNTGLPVKTIKVFQNGVKSFLQITQEVKDLEFNIDNPDIFVCATKDRIYLSRNRGQSWTNLGTLPYSANGFKAVAAANMPQLTVFLSHSIFGIYYAQPNEHGGITTWTELHDGLEELETAGNPDEIADIVVVPANLTGGSGIEIFASNTFRRRIYKLNWNQKKFDVIWKDESPFGTVDSLYPVKDNLLFLQEGTVASIRYSNDSAFQKQPDLLNAIRALAAEKPSCVVIENKDTDEKVILNELWLLDETEPGQEAPHSAAHSAPQFAHVAANREGLYMPTNHAMETRTLAPYLDTIQRAGLNMIVIDMKDDFGRLRFTPNNPAIAEKGRVFRPLDIDSLLRNFKNRGIYTVARIVVFKDPELAKKENGRYAVWDPANSKPWQGYRDQKRSTESITEEERAHELIQFFPVPNEPGFEIVRTYYDENWVDPYSEEVWEYIALLSLELHERGFDEIQFDYIRFPTDGDNLWDARYRWQDRGMDMESAILSFLRHARARINAPISIDIYGANGFYRTGARTGQEVELLAQYVDVICPMYYPSHFEQYFFAQNPPEMRPWRIYYIGTLRNSRIARGQAIIRPWTQAFYLNVSYDRQYYGPDYVRRQVEAVREAGNGGYTHWNNMGRYEDIPDK